MARRRPTAEFDATQSEAGPRTVTIDAPIGGYNGYVSPDLLSPKFWSQSSNIYAGQFGVIRRARWAPFLNASTPNFLAHGFRIQSIFGWSEPISNVNWVFLENNDPNAISYSLSGTNFGPFPSRVVVSDIPATLFFTGLTGSITAFASPVFFYVDFSVSPQTLMFNAWPLTSSLLNGPYMRTSISNLILEANNLYRSKVRIVTNPTFVPLGPGTPLPIGEFWGIDAPDVSPQIALASGSTATIQTAPTGAVRTSNIATITTTAAHGLSTGQYVGISGVTDTSFNSGAGQAFLITVTGASTFTYSNIGPNTTSGSGTVTLGITKTVGRSYQYAWENVNTSHVSAPSPASQFVKYASQIGTVSLFEVGTIASSSGSGTVTGTNTAFSPAWVGKLLVWIGAGNSPGPVYTIVTAVANSTSLTMFPAATGNVSGVNFQALDPQVTHARLYETGDGGSVYFKTARNAIIKSNGQSLALTGFQFTDTANSEPPNNPFSSEITQIFNVPPPIGQFVDQYQGRPIVYGVAGAPQTFFYGNIENTVVGQPPESFGTLNTVTLPIQNGKMFGTANLPTGFIIWSNRQDMFKLTGLLTDNSVANSLQLGATIQRLPYAIGCASPYATAVTPLGAIWLSSDREVWLFTDHYAPKNVGKPVQDVLNRINGSRLAFAKMSYYKRGDRSWLALAVALDSSTFNNKLLLLDLDLLASNGQPSFFTFDLATNAPTWYQFDINCEGLCTSYDGNSVNHLLVGDVDLITDVDWQPTFYTVSAEQNVPGGNKLHAFGNEDPHMIKTLQWMRALTNQIPKNLASQGWAWSVDAFDDDVYVIGVNPLTTNLIPSVDSNSNPLFLEYSPGLFKFGGVRPIKGRRFQIGCTFPSAPGLFELRGYQVSYNSIVGR